MKQKTIIYSKIRKKNIYRSMSVCMRMKLDKK